MLEADAEAEGEDGAEAEADAEADEEALADLEPEDEPTRAGGRGARAVPSPAPRRAAPGRAAGAPPLRSRPALARRRESGRPGGPRS